MPKEIQHIITLGDSLSDRGTMDHRKLFGFIPMAGLSGLKGHSRLGRFGNGLVWDDDLAIELYGQYTEEYEKKRHDALAKKGITIKHQDINTPEEMINENVIGNYREVQFCNQDLMRNYNEGGLTSYDWSGNISADISVDAKSRILANLAQKRALLLKDDEARGIEQKHKDKSLIIEWSGANDLITVHSNIYHPDGLEKAKEQAQSAIEARIQNVQALYEQGYRNFMLFNLPDLSLTPRFQNPELLKAYVPDVNHHEQIRKNAHQVCEYFNQELSSQIQLLKESYPDISLDLFDVNTIFCDAYQHPETYKLSPALKTHGVSLDFPEIKHQVNATNNDGYMFWDDVHPTSTVHEVLADKFQLKASENYHFTAPHESLLHIFKEGYGQQLEDDKGACFGFFRHSRINYLDPHLKLEDVFYHGLKDKGYRTRSILVSLGWLTHQGDLAATNHPKLVEAYEHVISPAPSTTAAYAV
ncbi:SGNH/GDSL hydrolase family protein [Legionella impletisoli]|uniref:Thermolabile hemolysin n=1 Tax=Legionella impletisoli TaxID=343510 RepID=A0A917JLL0_9GAMM|nr:SGNH/GDSL hydrolase family protein [Legionella impletisoli]GGI76329.1 hypothetical protein GCM10007966_01440 [Legionella impletisoli]